MSRNGWSLTKASWPTAGERIAVLIYTRDGYVDLGHFEHKKWYDSSGEVCDATHWMHVPAPPVAMVKRSTARVGLATQKDPDHA